MEAISLTKFVSWRPHFRESGLADWLFGLLFLMSFDNCVGQQLSTYEAELEVMKNMTRQEYVASLRR
jgi:hypothetical protein